MAKGKSDAEIAGILHLSEGDVEARVAGILDKLGIRDRFVMSLMLSQQGMISRLKRDGERQEPS
jgi:DNA-binding NarL/FixJ family response regulator